MTIFDVDESTIVIEKVKVYGGWIVNSTSFTQSIFVPDRDHEWLATDVQDPVDPPVDPVPPSDPPVVDPAPEPTPAPTPTPERVLIYGDAMAAGWRDNSWATRNLSHPDAAEGSNAILLDCDGWAALNFYKAEGFNTNDYDAIEFSIKATGDGLQDLEVALYNGGTLGSVPLAQLFNDGKLPTTTFEKVTVPFKFMGVGKNVDVLNVLFRGMSTAQREAVILDSIALVKAAVTTPAPDDTPVPTPAPVDGWMYTEGSKIYTSDGQVWVGKGVNVFDTRSCSACYWSEPDVEEVKRRIDYAVDDVGSNFLRICLETRNGLPTNVNVNSTGGVLDNPTYLQSIKDMVEHIGTKPGVKVLVSLWLEPTTTTYDHPTAETIAVWEKLVEALMSYPHVIFGCVNEPTMNFNGAMNLQAWTAFNSLVKAIRAVEDAASSPHHLIAVQGIAAWGRRLGYFIGNPIESDNVVYETHFYSPINEFANQVGLPAQTLPVIVGEFGPTSLNANMSMDDCQQMMTQCDALQVPYLAWCLHHRCPPNMLVDNSGGGCGAGMPLQLTDWGNLVKDHIS